MSIQDYWDKSLFFLGDLSAFASDLVEPTVRLGVTGLSGSGKSVFITSLVHNLISSGTLPSFEPIAEGRLIRCYLRQQPDDDVPRFAYEKNLKSIVEDRQWPEGTKRVSQLRLTIDYEPSGFIARQFSSGRLNIDIVDYPGEWLLDLPLLQTSYKEWCKNTIETSQQGIRAKASKKWFEMLQNLDPFADADETQAEKASDLFKEYLATCRTEKYSFSSLPPGRFLMPGDLEDSPALTFAPLLPPDSGKYPGRNSLWAMMERRYESYKSVVVKPFFTDHFARLDRQILLVDTLVALNAGVHAIEDLKSALSEIMTCFKPGSNSWLSSITGRKIDKILFAATKADHLHRDNHSRLEKILAEITQEAIDKAEFSGAVVDVIALASVRSTTEAVATIEGEDLNCIVGTPKPGQTMEGKTFDGETDTAIFPGDLPENPKLCLDHKNGIEKGELQFLNLRPPKFDRSSSMGNIVPHVRLDKALNFLFADKLR